MKNSGTQFCIDLFGCDEKKLNDEKFIHNMMDKMIRDCDFKLVSPIKIHKFEPQGITGYALLSASHLAIHSWPEHNYASFDVFACDCRAKVEKAEKILLEELQPKKSKKKILVRGYCK